MSNEECEKVLKELYEVRPEKLNDKAKRLFDAIMKIVDERDKYKNNIDKATNYINNIPESDDDYVSDYIFNIEDKEKMLEILKGE